MSFEDRRYVILEASDVGDVDFSKVMETSADTLLWNNDKSKTLVKYVSGSKPSFLTGKTALTHAQILTELQKDEWLMEV